MADTIPVSFDRDVEDAPLDRLRPHPSNPRQGDVGAIAQSVERFGWYQPIVAQRSTGYVLAGNHRFHAARALGLDTIPVVWLDVDETTAKAILVADNRLSDLATYDDVQLADLLRELAVAEQLAGTGYDGDDLDALLAEIAEREPPAADDDEQPTTRELFRVYPREQLVEEAFSWARERGFDGLLDEIELPMAESRRQINALAATPTEQLPASKHAQRVPERWQRHRWDVEVANRSKRTVRAVYENDDYLRHGIGLSLDADKRVNASDLLSTLSFTRGGQLAANFRPGFALSIYRRFGTPGGRLLDTSAGFGGRLVAFFASELSEYVGIDPSTVTQIGNEQMASELCPDDKSVDLIVLPAEDVQIERIGRETCDLAFTSPPYFGKEQYADESTQSWVRYSELDDWVAGFLHPMLALQHAALKSGAYSVLNIADVTIDERTTLPLVEHAIEGATAAGFTHVETERFPLMRVPGQGEQSERYEPVLIFRK